jgi:transposase
MNSLEKRIEKLLSRIDRLEAKVNGLETNVTFLDAENFSLKKENASIKTENELLKAEIARLKKGTDSSNSSKPPSSDMHKKKGKKQKRKGGKKAGGQKGHKGNHLEFRAQVDHVVEHAAENCSGCGACLADEEGKVVKKAQVIDIPPIQSEVTEHQQILTECSRCGMQNTSELPGTLDYAAVQYGENIRQLITYLSVRQYLPMARISELIEAICGERLSTGTIANTIEEYARKLEEVYWKIKDRISISKVVGSDETGTRICGVNAYIWTWQTQKYNFQYAADNRGFRTVEYCFKEGLPNSILVSDRYASQLKTEAKANQLCIAHLLRESKKLIDHYESDWAKRFKGLLHKIHELGSKSKLHKTKAGKLEKRLDRLLAENISKEHKEVKTFHKSMTKHKDKLTTCLYHEEVPTTNNASERAIRNIKVKQKISTNFRSWKGAENFTIIRSVIDTAIKQSLDPFKVLFYPELVLNSPE